jgi:MerR family transcriptional regulator/heat shock protein HspR
MTALMTIQTAAQEAGLSPNTLRIYERLGLLAPARDSAGRRLFSPFDIEQAKRIATERLARRGSGLRGARPRVAA